MACARGGLGRMEGKDGQPQEGDMCLKIYRILDGNCAFALHALMRSRRCGLIRFGRGLYAKAKRS